MAGIHPTAVIEPGAILGQGVRVGPFACVGPKVVLGDGVELKPHAVVTGDTHIGPGSTVFSFAVVGEVPQDLKYAGEPTALRIGARTRIREHATLNIGTVQGGGVTRVGDDCLIMAGVHVAHDCQLGDRVIIAGGAALAGHVVLGDDVIVGGLAGVHQFVRVGRGAMIGGLSMVAHDVLPFGLVSGDRGRLEGWNLVGLKRRQMPRADIQALRALMEQLKTGEGSFQDRARAARAGATGPVAEVIDFILAGSDRNFLTPAP
jgi:UDP-N-acetylglucosamine acyltransferase